MADCNRLERGYASHDPFSDKGKKGIVVEMIEITKLNGTKTLVNTSLIETVEETPDTVITLTSGKKIIVKESRQEVKNLVKLARKEIFSTDKEEN